MKLNYYYTLILLLIVNSSVYSQMNDCSDPVFYGCSSSDFVFSSVGDDFEDFPVGSVSAGCLSTGDNQLIYMVLQANSAGLLEWSLQGSGNTGYMDWAIWPYNPNTTCAELSAGTLAPLACCWNASGNGFTGMLNANNPLALANVGNTQPPINLSPGQTVLLGISNFSGSLDGQNITMTFNNPNLIACNSSANDQTICLGSSAIVNINTNLINNPTFNWIETNGVSNTSAGSNVIVTPTVTSTYHVVVSDITVTPVYIDTAVFIITVVNPPAPNAGVDDTICLGSPIHLNGVLSNSTDTYTWNSIAIGIAPTPTITITPSSNSLTPTATVNASGLYGFILAENNITCPIVRDTAFVLVSTTSQTTSIIHPKCNGSNDGVITINNPNAIQYSFDNGATWGTNSSLNAISAGTYTVCSKNAEGCQTCSTVQLTNPPIVDINVSNDTTICQNGTATLHATASGGNIFTYTWSQSTNTTNSQQYLPLNNSIYDVFVTNENGCVSTIKHIQVNVKDPIIGSISPDQSICPGKSINLIASAIGGLGNYQFTWNTPQIDNGISSVINVQPTSPRVYSVQIEDACESTPIILTTSIDLFNNPIPLFSVDEDSICEPAIFTIRNNTDPNSIGSFKWIISDGEIINNHTVINTQQLHDGYYDVKLIVTSPDGCIDSVKKINALISMPNPIPSFSYHPNPVKIFDTRVSFANTSLNSESFEWFIEKGSPYYANTENAKTIFPEGIAASYKVTLIATSDFGCIDSAINYVNVLPEIIFYAPNAFTPNGDEFNQTWKIEIDGIDIFDFKLVIIDRWGEIIWETNDPKDFWDGTYNGKKVEAGTYNWMMETKDKFSDERYRYNGSFSVIK